MAKDSRIMQKFSLLRSLRPVYLTALLALTACDAPQTTEVPGEAEEAAVLLGDELVVCPSDTTYRDSRRIRLRGGLLSVAGSSVLVPAEALSEPIRLRLAVPKSQYMLIDLRVNGEEHWQFLAPVTVTIDYSRCGLGLLDPPVRVWYVDRATGELLAPMISVDNRLLNQVTFLTDHFSGYAIAN
jgi:hypothetical protein